MSVNLLNYIVSLLICCILSFFFWCVCNVLMAEKDIQD